MLVEIARDLARSGLILRGGLAFGADHEAPAAAPAARAVLLVGHGGPSLWPHFQAWRARQPAHTANPLDTWSRAVIGRVAERFDARAVSPSDRPYLPFQQWAMRAEGRLIGLPHDSTLAINGLTPQPLPASIITGCSALLAQLKGNVR